MRLHALAVLLAFAAAASAAAAESTFPRLMPVPYDEAYGFGKSDLEKVGSSAVRDIASFTIASAEDRQRFGEMNYIVYRRAANLLNVDVYDYGRPATVDFHRVYSMFANKVFERNFYYYQVLPCDDAQLPVLLMRAVNLVARPEEEVPIFWKIVRVFEDITASTREMKRRLVKRQISLGDMSQIHFGDSAVGDSSSSSSSRSENSDGGDAEARFTFQISDLVRAAEPSHNDDDTNDRRETTNANIAEDATEEQSGGAESEFTTKIASGDATQQSSATESSQSTQQQGGSDAHEYGRIQRNEFRLKRALREAEGPGSATEDPDNVPQTGQENSTTPVSFACQQLQHQADIRKKIVTGDIVKKMGNKTDVDSFIEAVKAANGENSVKIDATEQKKVYTVNIVGDGEKCSFEVEEGSEVTAPFVREKMLESEQCFKADCSAQEKSDSPAQAVTSGSRRASGSFSLWALVLVPLFAQCFV